MHLFVSIHTAPKGGDNAGKSQADTTGAEATHERANRLAHAPPKEHQADTGSNESSENTNNGGNANLGRHSGDNGSPVRSGNDTWGRGQGDKFLHNRNGQNAINGHKKTPHFTS